MSALRKYDRETQARAVRMYADRLAESGISQLRAREEVGELLGINQSTLRNRIRRNLGEGDTPAVAIRRRSRIGPMTRWCSCGVRSLGCVMLEAGDQPRNTKRAESLRLPAVVLGIGNGGHVLEFGDHRTRQVRTGDTDHRALCERDPAALDHRSFSLDRCAARSAR